MPSMLLSVSMNAALFSIRASFASDDARSTSLKKDKFIDRAIRAANNVTNASCEAT